MEDNKLKSGYSIESIILAECSFTRAPYVSFDNQHLVPKANIDVHVEVKDNKIVVMQQLIYKLICEDKEQVSATISLVGNFTKVGESMITDLEIFGKQNGAAIMYPYIRELFTSLSVKAGLGLLFLPPVNFTKFEPEPEPIKDKEK